MTLLISSLKRLTVPVNTECLFMENKQKRKLMDYKCSQGFAEFGDPTLKFPTTSNHRSREEAELCCQWLNMIFQARYWIFIKLDVFHPVVTYKMPACKLEIVLSLKKTLKD